MRTRKPTEAHDFVRFPDHGPTARESIPRRIERLAPDVHDDVWFEGGVEDELSGAERLAPRAQIIAITRNT